MIVFCFDFVSFQFTTKRRPRLQNTMAVFNYNISEFHIVGFPELKQLDVLLSVIFLVSYILTLLGNFTVLYIIKTHRKAHTPMFFIILTLSVSNVIFSTALTPKIIARYMMNDQAITFHMCFVQMYFAHALGTVDAFVLMFMAIDRYLAVSHPLRYPSIMTNTRAIQCCCLMFFLGMLGPVTALTYASRVHFCGPNEILHFFCEHSWVVRLACADTTMNTRAAITVAAVVLVIPFIVIMLSYGSIIVAVIKIKTAQGRKKAFYTCSTQLLVISIFFFPSLCVYFAHMGGLYLNHDMRITLGILYSLLPPMLNPIIYSLKTKEIKEVIVKVLQRGGVGAKIEVIKSVQK
ncbi:O10G4 protein, partial [Amia calva]|nr:O10G4 protein [Amia calva]